VSAAWQSWQLFLCYPFYHRSFIDSPICFEANLMKKKAIALIISVLALSFSSGIFAQQTQGTLAESWAMTIKKGEQANFEAAFKAHAAVRKQAGDPRQWDVYVPVTGDNMAVYGIRTCCFTWADQDAYTEWERTHPEVMADWGSNVDQYVAHYGHYFSEVDLDHSHWGDSGQAIKYVGVTNYTIEPGKGAAFNAARAELSQIAINQGWAENHRWAWMDQVGGEPVVSLAVPFANFADMGDDEQTFRSFLVEQAGEEGAEELMERLGDSIESSNYEIWAHRPDLSTSSTD
jgi:hypothetical protein